MRKLIYTFVVRMQQSQTFPRLEQSYFFVLGTFDMQAQYGQRETNLLEQNSNYNKTPITVPYGTKISFNCYNLRRRDKLANAAISAMLQLIMIHYIKDIMHRSGKHNTGEAIYPLNIRTTPYSIN